MLACLRARVRGDAVEGDDLDHLVLESFLKAIRRIDLDKTPARTVIALKQETQRAVFAFVRERQKENLQLSGLCAESLADDGFELFAGRVQSFELGDDEREEIVDLLIDRVAGRVSSKRLRLVIEPHLAGVCFRAFVQREQADAPQTEIDRAYQRLKRCRSRVLASIRPLFGARECPH
jgi:hypothetical protein